MDYIRDMRTLIGHRPLILAGAAMLVFNPQGQLLLFRRTDNGCWGVPGGALEPGESLEQAARRETREETGLEVKHMELFGVFSGPGLFYEYPNGDQVHNVTAVYLAEEVSGEICLAHAEGLEYGFFDLQALPEPLSPPIIPFIHKLAAEHRPAG